VTLRDALERVEVRGGNNIEESVMCRNIKTLFNFAPPVTEDEIRAASLQFVRKVSGFNKPSKANEAAFSAAVDGITAISTRLLQSMETSAPPRYREVEAAKARLRSAQRFPRKDVNKPGRSHP
jgi:hypothetical protein